MGSYAPLPIVLNLKAPVLLLHGGLGEINPEAQVLNSLQTIAASLQLLLSGSSTALDLVLQAAKALEADPIFNAGRGAKLQADGVARLSAAIMDGSNQQMSAVINIEGFVHVAAIAADLLRSEHTSLAGIEAARFALGRGFIPANPITEMRYSEWKKKVEGKSGTVGAIALDAFGKTAACTSTGGRGMEIPGRVSDSCTPAGNFASAFGAVSCTGRGEEILDAAVASSIMMRLEDGMVLEEAVARTLRPHMKKEFGFIALDQKGNVTVQSTGTPVSFALVTKDQAWVGYSGKQWTPLKLTPS